MVNIYFLNFLVQFTALLAKVSQLLVKGSCQVQSQDYKTFHDEKENLQEPFVKKYHRVYIRTQNLGINAKHY